STAIWKAVTASQLGLSPIARLRAFAVYVQKQGVTLDMPRWWLQAEERFSKPAQAGQVGENNLPATSTAADVSAKLYKQGSAGEGAGAQAGPQPGPETQSRPGSQPQGECARRDGDVVDAEFEVVDEDKKK